MKIAIVGAAGLVGAELTKQLSDQHQVLALRHSNLDVTNAQSVRSFMLAERPGLIINCAVLGVDECEEKPDLAEAVNVQGPKNLAEGAAMIEADLVHFSTNYVFDGLPGTDHFYTIEDSPTPTSVYGQTKLDGERAAIRATNRCYIIRTSWVFGAGKESFFSSTPASLKAARKIRAISDVWASATYVRDLAARVIEIVSRGHYSTYHVVNGDLCSQLDFALEASSILKVSTPTDLIESVKLSELQLPAQRPRYTPLSCVSSRNLALPPLRSWRMALAEYIKESLNP